MHNIKSLKEQEPSGQALRRNFTKQKSIAVSVLMLSYNHTRYIRQVFNGALTQQISFQFEILVGNDVSQDGTAQTISGMAQSEPQLRPALRPRNIGTTRNLCNLQVRARGAYLAYLEGDDRWCDTHKLQKQADFLMVYPNYTGCTHGCRMMDELGEPRKSQYLSWIFQKERYTLEDFHGFVLPRRTSMLMHRNIFLNPDGAYETIITMHLLIGNRPLGSLLASQDAAYQLSDVMSYYRFSHTAGERNVTAVAYTYNTNRTREDYDHTRKPEVYAFQMLGVDGGFPAHKKSLFVSAIWAAFRHPNTEGPQIAAQILREGQSLSYLSVLPAGVFYKLREKHKQRSQLYA